MSENIMKFTNNSDKIFNKYLDELTKYIKNKNKRLSWCLPIIKIIKSNINFILLIFLFLTLYYSRCFINFRAAVSHFQLSIIGFLVSIVL